MFDILHMVCKVANANRLENVLIYITLYGSSLRSVTRLMVGPIKQRLSTYVFGM